jgi:hypothetical protein
MTVPSEKVDKLKLLRTFALGVLTAGALISLYITLQAGKNNKSILLIGLFFIWVISPFLTLLRASTVSKNWPNPSRLILYVFMMAVTILSLFLYTGIIHFPGFNHAFIFLVTPLITWVLLAIIYFVLRVRNN